jgi:cell wall-associated NlpC family hydrolase
LRQIDRINAQVGTLGQKYDRAQIKLNQINSTIAHTREEVAAIQGKLVQNGHQLKADAVFAYVTNGVAASSNPLFSGSGTTLGQVNVYTRLAQGNVSQTIANLQNNRLQLTAKRQELRDQQAQAAAVAASARAAYNQARGLQAQMNNTLRHINGQIALYIAQARAAAAAKDQNRLHQHGHGGFPAPPPNSRANIAIRAAMSYLGVWYRWGGASRSGVDCSGLTMLAYSAAHIYFPHYSGGQYSDTVRVPLWNLQPGDLLFWGWHGDQHVSMYVGHGKMIEASHTGTRVHIVPVRFGYGFAGAGRPRG